MVIQGVIVFIIDIVFDNAATIDSCLDNGGRWDYELKECVGSRSMINEPL